MVWSTTISAEQFNEALVTELRQKNPQFQKYEVVAQVNFKSYQSKLIQTECSTPQIKVFLADGQKINNIMFLPVRILANDQQIGELRLRYQIKIFAPVYFAKTSQEKGTSVDPQNLYLKKIDILQYPHDLATEGFNFSQRVLATRLEPGIPLAAWMFRRIPVVEVGEVIQAKLKTPGVLLILPAKILQPGEVGDVVRVKILPTGKMKRVKVLAKGEYEIVD